MSRYEENVTPGMIASVPSQGNEQMAATILQVIHAIIWDCFVFIIFLRSILIKLSP